MIRFTPIKLSDKSWVDEIVMSENSPSADYNFGNIYIWDKHFKQLTARCGDRMLTKLRYDGKPTFVFPIGSGELRPAIEALREFAAWRGYPFCLRGITEQHREMLEAEYPGRFDYTEDVNNADYIYLAEKLATYSGKALHGKKNHCNRFEAEYDWRFVPMTRELIPACMDMLSVWSEDNAARLDPSIAYEHDAIIRAFAAFEQLGLEGGVLYANGEIMGFTMGEFASRDTFDVHFEKARVDKIYGNDKLYPLIVALGAGIGNEFNIDKLRYHKIVIMADADVDGSHIRTLLLTFFFRYMRPLIENGYVYSAVPPLFKLSRGKQQRVAYSDEERDAISRELRGDNPDAKVDISRFKGLGEMDPHELWETTMDPERRTLRRITLEDAQRADEIFTVLMGDEVEPRRAWIETKARYVVNLDY